MKEIKQNKKDMFDKLLVSVFAFMIFIVSVSVAFASSPYYECTDSDGSHNYDVFGSVTGWQTTEKNDIVTVYDSCVEGDASRDMVASGTWLHEYSCSPEEVISHSWYECTNGCHEGRCLAVDEVVEEEPAYMGISFTVSETDGYHMNREFDCRPVGGDGPYLVSILAHEGWHYNWSGEDGHVKNIHAVPSYGEHIATCTITDSDGQIATMSTRYRVDPEVVVVEEDNRPLDVSLTVTESADPLTVDIRCDAIGGVSPINYRIESGSWSNSWRTADRTFNTFHHFPDYGVHEIECIVTDAEGTVEAMTTRVNLEGSEVISDSIKITRTWTECIDDVTKIWVKVVDADGSPAEPSEGASIAISQLKDNRKYAITPIIYDSERSYYYTKIKSSEFKSKIVVNAKKPGFYDEFKSGISACPLPRESPIVVSEEVVEEPSEVEYYTKKTDAKVKLMLAKKALEFFIDFLHDYDINDEFYRELKDIYYEASDLYEDAMESYQNADFEDSIRYSKKAIALIEDSSEDVDIPEEVYEEAMEEERYEEVLEEEVYESDEPVEGEVCEDGCPVEDKCLNVGLRFMSSEIPSYCDLGGEVKSQKAEGAMCQNNFECTSNSCSSGKCFDIQKQLEENRSLLKRIVDWLSWLF